ncbi:hypothetical protein D3C79_795260 [compost metagenome]
MWHDGNACASQWKCRRRCRIVSSSTRFPQWTRRSIYKPAHICTCHLDIVCVQTGRSDTAECIIAGVCPLLTDTLVCILGQHHLIILVVHQVFPAFTRDLFLYKTAPAIIFIAINIIVKTCIAAAIS